MSAVPPLSATRPPPQARRRVFVVDDHPLMRRSIVGAVEREPNLTVCGQAEDVGEALTAIAERRPDLVLTDLQLKSSSGLDLIKALREQFPALPVIATTMFDVRRNERLARELGAAGFAAKQDGPEKLMHTIQAIINTIKATDENP